MFDLGHQSLKTTADSPSAPDRRLASQFDASTSELQRWQFPSPTQLGVLVVVDSAGHALSTMQS